MKPYCEKCFSFYGYLGWFLDKTRFIKHKCNPTDLAQLKPKKEPNLKYINLIPKAMYKNMGFGMSCEHEEHHSRYELFRHRDEAKYTITCSLTCGGNTSKASKVYTRKELEEKGILKKRKILIGRGILP